MIKLVGSDLHDIDDLSLYSDMSFYKIRGDEIKKIMEKRWCEYYNKTENDFLKKYKKNYL